MLRIVLIEDQVMFRSSLAALLQSRLGAQITGAFSSGAEFRAALPSIGLPELILLDIQLPGEDGIALVKEFKEALKEPKIVLLSAVRGEFVLHRALKSEADGFVHKDDSIEALSDAISTAMAGGCYFGQTIQQLRRQMRQNPDSFSKVLSDREQEVLELLGQGLSNDEAGTMLAISGETVQAHRRNIMLKLGLHNAVQLQSYALKRGFTSVDDLR